MGRKFIVVILAITAVWSFGLESLPIALAAPPPPPPPSPPLPPSPTGVPRPAPPGGKNEQGGPSRFLHCNSTIKGFVTNYADHSAGAGVVVEIGASGWKAEKPADSNGFFSFGGLCEGTAYVHLNLPPGALPTHPEAEAKLDGKNEVQVDLGYFPPPSDEPLVVVAESSPASALQAGIPGATATPAVAADGMKPLSQRATGLSAWISAPQRVRAGEAARLEVIVRNGGPESVRDALVMIPLPHPLSLQEASTNRGSLRVWPGSKVEGGSVRAEAQTWPLEPQLVINVGPLAAGEAAVISLEVAFKENAGVNAKAALQAWVSAGGKAYQSNVATLSPIETEAPLQVTLPTTRDNDYVQAYRDLLW